MRLTRLLPVAALVAVPLTSTPPAAADCLQYTGSPEFAVCTNEGFCWVSVHVDTLVNWCLQRPPTP